MLELVGNDSQNCVFIAWKVRCQMTSRKRRKNPRIRGKYQISNRKRTAYGNQGKIIINPMSPGDILENLGYSQAVLFPNRELFASRGYLKDHSTNGDARPQQPGRAYHFDGIDDYVEIPYSTRLAILGPMTISFWVYADSWPATQYLVAHAASGETEATNILYAVYTNGTGQLSYVHEYGSGTNVALTYGNVATGAWHHIIIIRNPGVGVSAYIDGVQSGSDEHFNDMPTGGTSGQLTIGGLSYNSAFYHDGKIFDVRLYDRVVTANEISFLSSCGQSGDDPTAKNLAGQYKCDDTHLAVAYDSSGRHQHGTKENITASTFHYEDGSVPCSFQNESGYSEYDGILYPRNELEPRYDVLSHRLSYEGRVPRNVLAKSSSIMMQGNLGHYVVVDHDESLRAYGDWEIQVWCLFHTSFLSLNQFICIVGKGGGGELAVDNHNYALVAENDQFGVGTAITAFYENTAGDNTMARYPTAITFDEWHHYKAKYIAAQSTLQLFIDGELVAENTNASDIPCGESEADVIINANKDDGDVKGNIAICDATVIIDGDIKMRLPYSEAFGIFANKGFDMSGYDNHGFIAGAGELAQSNFNINLTHPYEAYFNSGKNWYMAIPHRIDGTTISPDLSIQGFVKIADVYPNNTFNIANATTLDFTGGVATPWANRVGASNDYVFDDALSQPNYKTQPNNSTEHKFHSI